jgi:hypothetical protein
MCQDREHRYRVQVVVNGSAGASAVVVYARGVAEAVAKADGWAQEQFGDAHVSFTVSRFGYPSMASAIEHGALNPYTHPALAMQDEADYWLSRQGAS